MSLDKVVEDILHRGEERKREILKLGEKERDETIFQAEKKAEEDHKKGLTKADALTTQMEQQEMSSAELESKKALLAAQRQVMEELKEHVLAELEAYPKDKRKKLYTRLAARAKKELGECYVYSNKDDKTLLSLPSGVSVGGQIDCRGGLVFESKDRSVRLDFRFESMVDEVWNKNMREIFAKLFG